MCVSSHVCMHMGLPLDMLCIILFKWAASNNLEKMEEGQGI